MWTGVWGGYTVSHAGPELTSRWTTCTRLHTMTSHKARKVVPVHAMKACGGLEVHCHSFSTSALDGISGQLHTSTALPAGKDSTVPIEQEAGWAPRADLDAFEKRKIFALANSWITIPPPSRLWPSCCLTRLSRLQHILAKTIFVLLSRKVSLWFPTVCMWILTVLDSQNLWQH